MIKQSWMDIVAGLALVEAMTAETIARCAHNGYGFASEPLCALQREQAARGIIGAEIVESHYGYSVRYDSGLQNFGLLASSRARQIDGTREAAETWARAWVAADPEHRYAWRRKSRAELETARLFYASGSKGPEVRADGQGGHLARGWYIRRGDIRTGTLTGPFPSKPQAERAMIGAPEAAVGTRYWHNMTSGAILATGPQDIASILYATPSVANCWREITRAEFDAIKKGLAYSP